jgi:dipeptidyl aminopeptidase/acylaminoacyl peptidase
MRLSICAVAVISWQAVAQQPSTYSGHGASSLSKEVLEKFAPKPIPDDLSRNIQAMLDVRAPGSGVVAPDGSALYFTWRVTGVHQMWKLSQPMGWPLQLTGGQDRTQIAALTHDGKKLIVQRDRKGEEYFGLYVQDAAGGPLQLVQHKPKVQTLFEFLSDDGRWAYYRANDQKPDSYAIYRYDLQDKRTEEVFAQPGLWSVADHRGNKLLLSKAVGSNMAEIFEWDEGAKSLKPLFGQGEREEYQPGYGPADGEIVVQTPKFGEFRRLYSWRAGKFTAMTPELKHDVAAFTIDDPRTRILYTVNEDGYTRLHAIDAKTHARIALPKLPPADHVEFRGTTHNGRFTVLLIDPGDGPAQSWVLDWNSGKLTQWHKGAAPEIDLSRFVRAKLETYPARDGTAIPVLVREPKDCKKPCPVVVEFHGGPEAQAQPGFSPYAQLFLDAGFIFVEPNVRGSDGYGKTWIHADDGARRLEVISDIEDAATWARKRFASGGKAPKVGITGGSYGGYAALMGMTMFGGAYDAGAEIVGISSLMTFLENTAPYRRALRTSEYGDPAKDRDVLLKLSPLTYLDRLKAPMLIVQGANDPRVPAGEAVQFYDALKKRGVDAEMLIFSDEGHGSQKRDNKVYEIGYTLRFFQKHLIADQAPVQ